MSSQVQSSVHSEGGCLGGNIWIGDKRQQEGLTERRRKEGIQTGHVSVPRCWVSLVWGGRRQFQKEPECSGRMQSENIKIAT